MKLKKLICTLASLTLAIGITGCSNQGYDQGYVDKYSDFYNDYNGTMADYRVYDTPDIAIEYYNNYEYPGNEGYVDELKNSYTGSRDTIQRFIDNIENNMETDDEELNQMNSDLINAGRQNINNINSRIEKLDQIPEDIYSNERNDFIRAVDEATKLEEDTKSQFIDLLNQMNDRLQIDMDQK